MKKNRIYLVCICLGLVILALSVRRNILVREKRTATLSSAPTSLARSSVKKASEIFSRAALTANGKQAAPKLAVTLPEACEYSWLQLSSLTMNQIERDVGQSLFPLDAACLAAAPEMKANFPQIDSACAFALKGAQPPAPPTDDQKRSCLDALTFYRARVIHRLVSNPKNLGELDSGILMNKILAEFVTEDVSPEAIERRAALARALIEKEPDLYAARKALAVAYFIDSTNRPSAQNESRMLASLKSAREMDPRDPELFEAEILPGILKGNVESTQQRLNDYRRENPQSAVPDYYDAVVAWRAGDRAKTISLLESCIKKEPGQPRYSETLARIKAAEPKTPNLFGLNIKFEFRDL